MRRTWIALPSYVLAALLAACSSPPQQHARVGPAGGAPADTYRTRPSLNFVDHSVGQEEVSIQAMSLVGVPYRWGGNTPDSGFDCSGLVRYVLSRSASVELPRTTGEMSLRGKSIEPDQIAPGDLIFFNTTGRPHSHVGIYVGKMRFVNAPSTGGTVRIDYLTNPYWAKRFDGIRRVAPVRRAPSPFEAPTLIAAPSAPATSAPSAPATTAPIAPITSAAIAPATSAPSEPAIPATAAAAVARTAPVDPVRRATVPGRDAFEPPPPSVATAQAQARAAGATAPDAIDAAAAAGSAAIGDAFEPPPPADTARAQARALAAAQLAAPRQAPMPAPGADATAVTGAQAGDTTGYQAGAPVQSPTQSATADDPIARFASGRF